MLENIPSPVRGIIGRGRRPAGGGGDTSR